MSMINRRLWLDRMGTGTGGVALAWLLARENQARSVSGGGNTMPGPEIGLPHFVPKAKRVLHIFHPGGISHVDTFDYKPELAKQAGKEVQGKKMELFFGQPGRIMKSPFGFKQYGQSGTWMSDIFPNLSRHADDLTFLHGMVAKSANHTPAGFQMNTGFVQSGFPAMGSWVQYALGAETEELPAFVVLPDPRGLPAGGSINWSSGFLPATYQGVPLQTGGKGPLVDNLEVPGGIDAASRKGGLGLLETLNTSYAAERPLDDTLRARIRSYEMAGRLQTAIPHVADLSGESKAVRSLYGLDDPKVEPFARNCLLARRMLERGVRFVQMFHGGAFGSPRINWDGHEDLRENHTTQSAVIDRPFSALLADLKARGMWEDTLILWTTEFGRTPITQGLGASGRDHHPFAFTIWMAGAGLKPGHHGVTDELGFAPVDGRTTIYDFHATVLYLLGLDHTRLSYYSNGVKRRLTDVHGEVIDPILA
jgi:hypothetical protein